MADSKINSDQGFNDAELEDIMNEIESLERDFDMTSDGDLAAKPDPIMEEIAATMGSAPPTEAESPMVAEDIFAEADEILEQAPVAEVDPIDAALESALAAELEELTQEQGDLRVESSIAEKTALQGVIDQEVDELLKERDFDELGDSPISEAEASAISMEPNVVEMTKPTPVATPKPQPEAIDDSFETIMETIPMPSAKSAGTPAPTEMSFSMSGTATVNLNFKISGQSIDLRVSEAEGFIIEMANGMKFSVPIQQADAWKKAS